MMKQLKKMAAVFLAVLLIFSSYNYIFADSGWDGITETECSEGTGDPDTPYLISSAEELAWFRTQVNNGDSTICAKLIKDIDLNNMPWLPIGGDATAGPNITGDGHHPFRGVFDGNSHTISGFNITITETTASNRQYLGLFGYAMGTQNEDTVIKDLILNGSITITSSTTQAPANIGGICGLGGYLSLSNCTSNVDISVNADRPATNVGGCVGYIYLNVSITDCVNTGDVSGYINGVGGITGACYGTQALDSMLLRSCNYGSIAGNTKVGGLAGTMAGTVKNCYNIGSITVNGQEKLPVSGSGGLIGFTTYKLSVNNCFTIGVCDFTNAGSSYTGAVYGNALSAYGNSFTNVYYVENGCSRPCGSGSEKYEVTKMTAEELYADLFVETLNLNAETTVFKKGLSHPIFVWQKEDAPTVLLGDIDGNGMVNAADVTNLIDCIAMNDAPACDLADMNGDGMVNAADVIDLIAVIAAE